MNYDMAVNFLEYYINTHTTPPPYPYREDVDVLLKNCFNTIRDRASQRPLTVEDYQI